MTEQEEQACLPMNEITDSDKRSLHDLFATEGASDMEPASDRGCSLPKRYILALLVFFGFANLYALRVNLSVTIVAMTAKRNRTLGNSTFESSDFSWTSSEQGLLLSSFFYGYILTQLPGGYVACKYSAKLMFGISVLGTAFLTILTPVSAGLHYWVLFSLRLLEGLCQGVAYPAIQAVWSHWAPALERTKLATIGFAGSHFGTVVTLPLSGWLANQFGWPSVFYVFGTVGVFWFVLWHFCVYDEPANHPTISKDELAHIKTSVLEQRRNASVPWRQLVSSVAVWAIVLAHMCENWGFYTMLTELPTYLSNSHTFGLPVEQSGLLSAVPYASMALTLVLSGVLADWLRGHQRISTTGVRKIFTSGGFVLQALLVLMAGFARSVWLFLLLISLSIGCGGFVWSGFAVNPLDVAPQYAAIIFGLSNTLATLPGIVAPTVVGGIVGSGQFADWQVVFYVASGVYMLGAVVYGLLARAYPEPWAEYQL